jgi:hypothetical protein
MPTVTQLPFEGADAGGMHASTRLPVPPSAPPEPVVLVVVLLLVLLAVALAPPVPVVLPPVPVVLPPVPLLVVLPPAPVLVLPARQIPRLGATGAKNMSAVSQTPPGPQSASVQQYCAHWFTFPAMSRGKHVERPAQNGPLMLPALHVSHVMALLGGG